MRLIEGKINGKKIVSGRCNGVHVFNTKYQTFVNFTVERYKYSKEPFAFNKGSLMVIYLELTESFDRNANNNFIVIGNGEHKSTVKMTDAEHYKTDTGTIIYTEYVDIMNSSSSEISLTDGAVIPISITFTNSKGQIETYNNYNGKYAQPVYDNTAPTIILNGGTEIHVNLDKNYSDEGITVDDNYLPEHATINKSITWYSLTGKSKTVNNVDTAVEGRYNINYTVYDTANNKTSATQLVYIDNPVELAVKISYDTSVVKQTKAIITANKVIKLPAGWTYVDESEKSVYKIYTQTTSENVSVYDLKGNLRSVSIKASIKTAPVYKSLGIIKNKDVGDTSSTAYAKDGDNVRIQLSFAELLAVEPIVTVNGKMYTATYRNASSNPTDNDYYYMADFNITSDMPEGEIMFTIGEYADNLGNIGETLNNSNINISSCSSVTIDRTAPTATFTYSNDNGLTLTNKDVTVTLNASEDIQELDSWTKVSETVFTKVFSENIKGSLTIFDLAGNSTEVPYEVKKIDKIPPVIDLSNLSNTFERGVDVYTYPENVVITDNSDGEMSASSVNIQWYKANADGSKGDAVASFAWGTTLSDRDLGNYYIYYWIRDKAGNTGEAHRIFTLQDTIAPTVISETRDKIENTVVVTLEISEKIQIPDGWTKGDSDMVITKTFAENFDGTVSLIDLAGNVTNYQLKVEISSGNVPANVVKVEYNIVGKDETKTYYVNKTASAGSIFISILLDKQLANIPTFTISDIENHSFDLSGAFAGEKNNGYYYTATQTISSLSSFVDGEITFKISDIVDADGNAIGNISEATNGSKIILDTVAPEVTFTYSNNNGLALTSGDVTVTVTANEQIQDITGWDRKTNNSLTKVFTKNTKGSLTVFDMAGNSTKASYEVKRIDKTPPDITIKTGSSETVGDATNGYSKISFKIHDSSGMVSWQINDGVITKLNNASWSDINYLVVGQKGVIVGNNVLKVTDKIGNVGTKTFKMING